MLDRTIAPTFQSLKDFVLPEPTTIQLKNKQPLYVFNLGSQPLLHIQLVFEAGKWYENKKGQAFMAAKMMLEGTLKKEFQQLHLAFDQYGSFWDVSSDFDFLTVELYCLAEYMKPMLELVVEVLASSSFPVDRLELQQHLMADQIRVSEQKNSFLSSKVFREKLFGLHHPYGPAAEVKHVEALTLDDLKGYYQTNILGAPFQVLVAGKLSDTNIQELQDVLGAIPVKDTIDGGEIVHTISSGSYDLVHEDKEEALQTSLKIGKVLPFKRQSAESVTFSLLNDVLGGYFGSRLMKKIREEKGYTYGINSSITSYKNERFLMISSDLIKEHVLDAVSAIDHEIQLLQQEKISNKELEQVKNYVAGRYLKSINTPMAIADYFKSYHIYGTPKIFFDEYVSRVYNTTAEDLQAMAQQYLVVDSLYKVLIG